MTIGNMIEGLTIFRKYFRGQDGYHVGSAHDAVLVWSTHEPMTPEDVETVKALGWFQPEAYHPDDVDVDEAPYDPDEYWKAYV